MDNNFKFKTRHVSIVQRSSSVVNSFASSVELIRATMYKLKRHTIQPLSDNLYPPWKLAFTGKRDSGTKFTSPELCEPFTQTVNRPVYPCK